MHTMTPDLARMLVDQRIREADERQRRRAAARDRRAHAAQAAQQETGQENGQPTRVPQQRRRTALLARFVPGHGAGVSTR
jgi:hypothetical protein